MALLLEPFTGFVPSSEFASRIVGPPVSMLSSDQRDAAHSDPLSFRHVAGKGAGTSAEEATEWLHTCRQQGALTPVGPAVFVYRLAKEDMVTTGIVADVSIAAYDSGLVKRHETTISETERRMADFFRSTRIHGSPVALAHRPHRAFDAAIAAHSTRPPDFHFVAADGIFHSLWVIDGAAAAELCAGFEDPLYITDGHHRLAAASVVAAEGRTHHYIPAGVFSADELQLRAFARCVVDPDIDTAALIARLGADHHLEEVAQAAARPQQRHDYGVKIADRWFRLRIDEANVPHGAYESLDVNLLQDLILSPMLGITDPRRDPRLQFVPDLPEDGNRSIDVDCGVWFLPFPALVADVMAVADAGRVMPPKSTWFAPKLPSGLVIRLLDTGD